ncbi:MAG: hypothetical protein ACT4P8_01545 [Betaproteobacteria bacterium]
MLPYAEPTARAVLALALVVALAVPAMRNWLESAMVLHMLVQLPLLALSGFWIGRAWLAARHDGAIARMLAYCQTWNAGGATGLVMAAFIMVMWMLPRFLDLARLDPVVDAIKFMTIAAAGVFVAVSWRRCPGIARAVVHLEVIAMLLRFGWGYLAAEDRLCLVYLANEQQEVGTLLLWLAALYAIAVIRRPLFGGRHVSTGRAYS